MRSSSAEKDKDKSIPHWVGRYEVLVPIASGGMATVYLARSRGAAGFERDVALKLTHKHLREAPEFQTVLIEEAKLASAIRHHNVVPILDVGDDEQGLFLVMDYVEGDTLSGLLRRARTMNEEVPKRIAFRVLLDALAGLHAAHETRDSAGIPLAIVHRDFSPHNILVGVDGVARLTDFGIAKATSRAGNTATGIIKGKVAYMAPEQARGKTVDRRCDIWAAGVLAWEIVANRQMWSRDGEEMAMLIKLVTEPPPSLREAVPDVPVDVCAAIDKALAFDMNDRWPTAGAFAKALAKALDAHDWIADHEEVSVYVRTEAGPKLAHRHERAHAAVELRARLGEVAEATLATPSGLVAVAPQSPSDGVEAVDSTEISKSAPQAIAPSPESIARALESGAPPAAVARPLEVAPPRPLAAMPPPMSAPSPVAVSEPDLADLTFPQPPMSSPAMFEMAPRVPRNNVPLFVGLGVAVFLVCLVGVVSLARHQPTEVTITTPTAPPPKATPTAPATATIETSQPKMTATTPPLTKPIADATTTTPAPSATIKLARPPFSTDTTSKPIATTPPTAKPADSTKKPKLAPSPY